jgi:hypothetical protein
MRDASPPWISIVFSLSIPSGSGSKATAFHHGRRLEGLYKSKAALKRSSLPAKTGTKQNWFSYRRNVDFGRAMNSARRV